MLKSRLEQTRFWIVLVALMLGMATVLPLSTASPVSADNPVVLPQQPPPFGKTYGQWSVDWWNWAFSIPYSANHPLFQTQGVVDCSVGQTGQVWFIAGAFGGLIDRTCTIPQGKALFFPIINFEADNLFNVPTTFTESELRAATTAAIDAATSMSATVDGASIPLLAQNYRAASPSFSYSYPTGGLPTIFGCEILCANAGSTAGTLSSFPGVYPYAVSDGVWLMLAPLSVGAHTIHFTATAPGFDLDVTYHLTVQCATTFVRICSGGPSATQTPAPSATATATPPATATVTPSATATRTPTATATPRAPACVSSFLRRC